MTQLTLFADEAYVPFVSSSATSRDAAESMKPTAASLREKVFQYIKRCGAGGATDTEVQAALGMDGSTQRPRRIELMRAGRITEIGIRKTVSNRNAVVWGAA